MKIEKRNRLEQFVFGFIIFFLLLFGGLGIDVPLVRAIGGVVSAVMVVLVILLKKELVFPRGFYLYGLFMGLFGVSLWWSSSWMESFYLWGLFASGGLFWLMAFNMKGVMGRNFGWLLMLLGLILGGLAILAQFGLVARLAITTRGLVGWASGYHNHRHIGDYWAMVLIVWIYRWIKELSKDKFKWVGYWGLIILAGYLLLISHSRSAYLALAVGLGYMFWKQGWLDKYKKIFGVAVVILVVLFLYASASKTTLGARDYYIQSMVGLVKYPLGVGVGNFGVISGDKIQRFVGLSNFSGLAHNLLLEFISGMGVLGIVFIIWLANVLSELINQKDNKQIIWQGVFIGLLVNFMFDTTYFIPAMLWLWFMVLGLAQKRKERGLEWLGSGIVMMMSLVCVVAYLMKMVYRG